MMKWTIIFTCVLYGFSTRGWLGLSNGLKICASFDFPLITSREITMKEKEVLTFTYNLTNITCGPLEVIYIHVRKSTSRQCEYELRNGMLSVTPEDSLCTFETPSGPFKFTKLLDRTDTARWLWSASTEDRNIIAEYSVMLFVTYPSRVTSLAVNGMEGLKSYQVQENQNVQVDCAWNPGSPPTLLRLLDGHGAVLSTSNKSNISIRIGPVNCSDAGIFECAANGSDQNQSVALLIVCPPSIFKHSPANFHADYGLNGKLNFTIRMHSPNITDCQLKQLLGEVTIAEYHFYQCNIYNEVNSAIIKDKSSLDAYIRKCSCTIHGKAPVMILTIDIFNITLKDNGRWELSVFNNIGNDVVDFRLSVRKEPPVIVNATRIKLNARVSDNPIINFSIVTHSAEFTACLLSKYKSDFNQRKGTPLVTYECGMQFLQVVKEKSQQAPGGYIFENCLCYIIGTTPEMTIEVQMFNVREVDSGNWRITIFNQFGNTTVDFLLQIKDTENNQKTTDAVLISSVVGGIAVLTIIVIIVSIVIYKRGRTLYDRPKNPQQEPVIYEVARHRVDRSWTEPVEQSSRIYDDILGVEDVFAEERITSSGDGSRRRTQALSDVDGYIHPIPTDTGRCSYITVTERSTSTESTDSNRSAGYLHPEGTLSNENP